MIETMPGIPLGSELFATPRKEGQYTFVRSTLRIDKELSVVEHMVNRDRGPYTEAVYVLDDCVRHVLLDRNGVSLEARVHALPPREPVELTTEELFHRFLESYAADVTDLAREFVENVRDDCLKTLADLDRRQR